MVTERWHSTLFALEPDTPAEELLQLVKAVESLLLISPKISELVQRRLFARTLPYAIAYDSLQKASANYVNFQKLLSEVIELQPAISRAVMAFDAIDENDFVNGKEEFRRLATFRGMFRAVVLAASSRKDVSTAKFELYKGMADQANHRTIINTWTEIFEKTAPLERDWSKLKEAPPPPRFADYDRAGGRLAYEQAKAQQRAIIDRLRQGDETRARDFAKAMVASQRKTSEPEHIAKSLTSISTQARELQAYTLSLEWAHEATTVKPDDARAWAHVAEAFVHFGKFTQAMEAIEKGEPFGEKLFYMTLRARILRLQVRLPDALIAYQKAIEISAGTVEEPFNLAGAAEVLRDMGRF